MMSQAKNADITDYVTNGILFWLDGIYNTANGHDATSSIWEDLSGNEYSGIYRSVNIIGDNYFSPNGEGLTKNKAFQSDFTDAIKSGSTIEIVCEVDPINSRGTVFAASGNGIGTTYAYNGSMCFSSASSSANQKSVALASGVHYYNSSLWRDGLQQQNTLQRTSHSSAVVSRFFCYSSITNNVFSGKVYALRVYNRILTDAELTKNWLTDKKRFGIS